MATRPLKRPPFAKVSRMQSADATTALPPQLDALCIRLTLGDGGLRTRQQKYFRVSVPQAVLGYEIVQWLTDNLGLDDATEGLHVANLLSKHGYVFPVIERTNTVKDDSTLYRYQIPYFWPSHNKNPDDVEYAIYLNKRLLRNEDKHGLEEHEVEAYNKLMELLGHMWDFITVQAEMQLKLHKEKKKSEKAVVDSQERAFWRLHRPPVGQANAFEEKYGKSGAKVKRKTAKHYESELERLRFALRTKPWLKSPKATETLVSWSEQFCEYDAFLTGCVPSNPWVSDEPTLWTLNADHVDVPTERRVRRWGISVQELVHDPIGRQVLETFLESEFSSENIRFWLAYHDLKYSPVSAVPEKTEAIYEEFLAPGAPCQVNIDSRTLEYCRHALADKKVPQRHAFSPAEEHIFTLMSKDSYPRFVRSEIYKGVLNAAQQKGSKRIGWKKFISNVGYKKSTTYSTGKKMPRDDSSGSAGLSVSRGDAHKKSGHNDISDAGHSLG